MVPLLYNTVCVCVLQCKEMCVEVQDNLLKEIRDLSEVRLMHMRVHKHVFVHTMSCIISAVCILITGGYQFFWYIDNQLFVYYSAT